MILMNSDEYIALVENVKKAIKKAQYRATIHVNAELLRLYHAIGTEINAHKSWGSKFIDSLAKDLKAAFPDATGYSVRNLKYMAQYASLFSESEFGQVPLAQITWYHHITLMDKAKSKEI